MLLMNGSDHLLPQPWLGRVVAAANAAQAEYRFAVTSLGEYVRDQPVDGLSTWCGELRSGARANVLMGVASNRVDVHQAAARAERSLERVAEPLSALLLAPDAYPGALLDIGWQQLILNSAHDSSCACSADEVVEAVRVRYQEARHIGEALTRDALRQLATTIDAPPSSTIVVNSTAGTRAGVVTVPLPGEGPVHLVAVDDGVACPTQVVTTTAGEGISTVVVGQKIRWVLEMMRGPELAGARIALVERCTLDDGTVEFTFHDAAPGEPELDLEATKAELLALGESGATIAIRQRRAPVREVVVATDPVPGFGWRTYRAVDGAGPTTAVRAEGRELANEHLRVEVDPGDGTLTIEADGVVVRGANRYVDGGDGGDTYNYSPPTVDTVIDRPETVRIAVAESGPVRARMIVTATYEWPAEAIGDERVCARRSDALPHDRRRHHPRAAHRRAVPPRARRARPHRAATTASAPTSRFPRRSTAPTPSARSRSCTAGSPPRADRTSTDSPRSSRAGSSTRRPTVVGLALLHDGLLEYEVVDDGRELALTLLRATGYLSRSELSLRPNPAGPLDPLEGPQLQGRLALDYAVLPHQGDWHDAALPAAADEFLVPLQRVRGGGWRGADRRADRLRPSGRRCRGVGAPARRRRGARRAGGEPCPEPLGGHARHGRRPARGRDRRPHRRDRRDVRRLRGTPPVGAPHAPRRRSLRFYRRGSGAASNASPRASLVTQSRSSPGAVRHVPSGASHNSAGRSPCQRIEYDTGPRRVGASRTSND